MKLSVRLVRLKNLVNYFLVDFYIIKHKCKASNWLEYLAMMNSNLMIEKLEEGLILNERNSNQETRFFYHQEPEPITCFLVGSWLLLASTQAELAGRFFRCEASLWGAHVCLSVFLSFCLSVFLSPFSENFQNLQKALMKGFKGSQGVKGTQWESRGVKRSHGESRGAKRSQEESRGVKRS
jgi:hypothetical protein